MPATRSQCPAVQQCIRVKSEHSFLPHSPACVITTGDAREVWHATYHQIEDHHEHLLPNSSQYTG
eukprot:366406-Chlamydomonas_euryale.AAC.34